MNQHHFQLEPTAMRAADPAWPWVALILTLALIGLAHDLAYATAFAADSAEAGRNFEQQAEFQADVGSASLGRKLGFGCLLLVGAYCIVTIPRGRRFRLDSLSALISLALIWALSSVLWSVAPGQTIRELIRLFAYLFVASSLALRFDPRSLCLVLMTTLIASVGTSVGIEVVTGGFRPWVPDYRLSGTIHSASLGIYAMLLVLGAYALARRGRSKFWWGIFFASVAVLVLSKALTSFIACAVGIGAIHLFDKSKRGLLLGAACAVTMVAALLLVTSATDFWSAFRTGSIDTMGRDYDFTSFNGRVPLWNILCDRLQDRWLQGFGYAGFWISKNIEGMFDELGWYASHSHSAYLGTIVHVGLIGFLLCLTIAILAFQRTISQAREKGSPEFFVFAAWLTAAFFISIAESAFIDPRDIGLFSAAIVFSCVVTAQSVVATAPAQFNLPSVSSSSPSIAKRGLA